MNKKEINVVILLIVVGLIIFAAGAGLGIFYQNKKNTSQLQEAEKISAEIKSLSSDIVTAVAAYGKVTAINGRDVTLSYNGKTLTINVAENIPVTSLQAGSKNLKFSDIKQGDNLNIALKIAEDGKLIAQSIIILSFGSI